jgi:hypothetical protein
VLPIARSTRSKCPALAVRRFGSGQSIQRLRSILPTRRPALPQSCARLCRALGGAIT